MPTHEVHRKKGHAIALTPRREGNPNVHMLPGQGPGLIDQRDEEGQGEEEEIRKIESTVAVRSTVAVDLR